MEIVIISIVIFVIVVIILSMRFSLSYSSPEERGHWGEISVSYIIGETKEGEQYVLNDFLFSVNGKTAQIDHIVIKPSGVFVIETKNYSGRIYGNENQHEWTQVLSYGNVKNKFYNPVKQNATHVYRLKKIIKDDIPIVPVVVFVQNNTEYIDSTQVVPLENLNWVLNIDSGLHLETAEMEEIFHKLLDAQQNTDIEEHVANIIKVQDDIESGICPRCGGKLVVRKGRYGDFVGCENYPDCKFTKKFDQ